MNHNILLFKKDLEGYSHNSLRSLQRHFGLPAASPEDLRWLIAIYQAKHNLHGTMPTAEERERLLVWARENGVEDKIRAVLDSNKELDLRGNQLTALPAELGALVNLEVLDLRDNQLTALPAELGALVNLQDLDLGGNQLTALPAEIGELKNLKWLDLSRNQLTALPAEIGELKNLQDLDLGGNQLTALPAEIGGLKDLKWLDLSRNQLTALPREIGGLVNLRRLNVYDNPLKEGTPRTITELREQWQLHSITKEEDLPYAGRIIDAMRAQDRPAIRLIQRWKAAREAERRREEVQAAAEVPEYAQDCENPIDYISQENWSAEQPPNVKVEVWDTEDPINGPKRTICFDRDGLIRWMEDQTHLMAPWIPNQQGRDIDDDGHGGGPSKTIFSQLPERTLIFGAPRFNEDHYIAIPTATDIRVGNRVGTLGVSELHGQVPGKIVYTVYPRELADYQEIFRDSFLGDLTSRGMYGGIMLLKDVLIGEEKNKFINIFNDIIAESIDSSESADWDSLSIFSGDERIIALGQSPQFRSLFDEFNTSINYEQNERAGAIKLREIFLKLVDELKATPDDTILSNAYEAIVENFYPDWAEDVIVEQFLSNLSFGDVIKASQRLWNRYPATDEDYSLNGERRGPGISYREESEAEESGGEESEAEESEGEEIEGEEIEGEGEEIEGEGEESEGEGEEIEGEGEEIEGEGEEIEGEGEEGEESEGEESEGEESEGEYYRARVFTQAS